MTRGRTLDDDDRSSFGTASPSWPPTRSTTARSQKRALAGGALVHHHELQGVLRERAAPRQDLGARAPLHLPGRRRPPGDRLGVPLRAGQRRRPRLRDGQRRVVDPPAPFPAGLPAPGQLPPEPGRHERRRRPARGHGPDTLCLPVGVAGAGDDRAPRHARQLRSAALRGALAGPLPGHARLRGRSPSATSRPGGGEVRDHPAVQAAPAPAAGQRGGARGDRSDLGARPAYGQRGRAAGASRASCSPSSGDVYARALRALATGVELPGVPRSVYLGLEEPSQAGGWDLERAEHLARPAPAQATSISQIGNFVDPGWKFASLAERFAARFLRAVEHRERGLSARGPGGTRTSPR